VETLIQKFQNTRRIKNLTQRDTATTAAIYSRLSRMADQKVAKRLYPDSEYLVEKLFSRCFKNHRLLTKKIDRYRRNYVKSHTLDEQDQPDTQHKKACQTTRDFWSKRESRILKSPLETTIDNFKQVFKKDEHSDMREWFSETRALSNENERMIMSSRSPDLIKDDSSTRLTQLFSTKRLGSMVENDTSEYQKPSMNHLVEIYSKISSNLLAKRYHVNP